jgi:hypothetical protein
MSRWMHLPPNRAPWVRWGWLGLIVLLIACSRPASTTPNTPAEVLDRFRANGIPIEEVSTYSAATDPTHLLGRPGQYIAKATWRDGRLPARRLPGVEGGTLEIFANEAERANYQNAVVTVTTSATGYTEYRYAKGPVLVRLTHELTADQAADYERVVAGL